MGYMYLKSTKKVLQVLDLSLATHLLAESGAIELAYDSTFVLSI